MIVIAAMQPEGSEHLTWNSTDDLAEPEAIDITFPGPLNNLYDRLSNEDKAWLRPTGLAESWVVNLDSLRKTLNLGSKDWLHGEVEVPPIYTDGMYHLIIHNNAV